MCIKLRSFLGSPAMPFRDSSSNNPGSSPIGRRSFLSTLAKAGFGALVCPKTSWFSSSSAPAPAQTLIDVHHHFVPPFYISENRDQIAKVSGGQIHPAYLSWTPGQAIAAMDSQGVATAVLSLTTPGVWFGEPKFAAQRARKVNEYGAELARDHPGRFGLFASLPLPDTDASLREIDYAFEVLKANGIGLLTSYDDRWLGDPGYEAVFEELNRRKAVVFVHPTVPSCCRTLLPNISPIMTEIPQDTTRAVTNLLFTGTFARFREIRFIFTHAGGNVPMVIGRMHQYAPKEIDKQAPHGIDYELKRLHYDVAGTAYRPAIAALTALVPATQILFGSDNPFIPLTQTARGITEVGLSASDLQAITHENALRLMPTLKKV